MNIYHLKRIRKNVKIEFKKISFIREIFLEFGVNYNVDYKVIIIDHQNKIIKQHYSIILLISNYLKNKYGFFTSESYNKRKSKIILKKQQRKIYNDYITNS